MYVNIHKTEVTKTPDGEVTEHQDVYEKCFLAKVTTGPDNSHPAVAAGCG